jgi:hypothetical protein
MKQPWDNPLTIPLDVVESVLLGLFTDNDDEDELAPEEEHPTSSGEGSLGRLLSVFVKGLRRSSRSGRREDDEHC